MSAQVPPEAGTFRFYMQRIWGFLWANQTGAESLEGAPNPAVVEWMQRTDGTELADYARDVARAGFDRADDSLVSLQTKADATTKLVLTLAPIAFAVTGIALASGGEPDWAKWIGFILFCGVDVCLVASGLLSFLASGLVLTGGVNPATIPKRAPTNDVIGFKASEADAWYYAMVVTNWSAKRVGIDLFHARRMVIWALLLAAFASPFISLGL